jgi:hypothetical protein
MLSLMATNTILYMGFSFNDECLPLSLRQYFVSLTVGCRYLNEFRSEVLSMLRPRVAPSASHPSKNVPPLFLAKNQPIAYAICPDFSLGKQQFFERHEGVKIMSWSTTKEKSASMLPNFTGTPTSPGTVAGAQFSWNQDPMSSDSINRAYSASRTAAGVWYSGLDIYLFRILTETSMSVGWGRMLKDKRVSRFCFCGFFYCRRRVSICSIMRAKSMIFSNVIGQVLMVEPTPPAQHLSDTQRRKYTVHRNPSDGVLTKGPMFVAEHLLHYRICQSQHFLTSLLQLYIPSIFPSIFFSFISLLHSLVC